MNRGNSLNINKFFVTLLLLIMVVPSYASVFKCNDWYKQQSREISISNIYGQYCSESIKNNGGINTDCLIFKERKEIFDSELNTHSKVCKSKDLVKIRKNNNVFYREYVKGYGTFLIINTFIDTYVALIPDEENKLD